MMKRPDGGAGSHGNAGWRIPIVEEPVTLEVLTTRNNWGAVKSFDEIWVLNWYEELTGVDVNWQVVLQDAAQKVNLMLASQTDLLMCSYTISLRTRYCCTAARACLCR